MRLMALIVVFGSAMALCHADENAKQAPPAAFTAWGEYLAGGVWTGTDANGDPFEERWEWILDRSFLQVTWKATGDSGMSVTGLDPATGQLAWWGFDNDGRVWKGAATLEGPDVWSDDLTAEGKAGSGAWKTRLIRVGDDTMRLEIEKNVVDGKTYPAEVITLSRKK